MSIERGGSRKQAFQKLDIFIKSTQDWTDNQKTEFIIFLFTNFENALNLHYRYRIFPLPFAKSLIKPTLERLCEIEKTDNRFFRWLGKFSGNERHLFKALELNIEDDLAREKIIARWIDEIRFFTFHFPLGDGDINELKVNLNLMNKIKAQIAQLRDEELKERWAAEIKEDIVHMENFKEWKDSAHPNLAQWASENKKIIDYNPPREWYNEID